MTLLYEKKYPNLLNIYGNNVGCIICDSFYHSMINCSIYIAKNEKIIEEEECIENEVDKNLNTIIDKDAKLCIIL